MCHQGAVVSKESFWNNFLHPLSFSAEAAKVEEGSICSVLQVHAVIGVSHSMEEDTRKEEVEEHWARTHPCFTSLETANV